ncbi:VOC family protein [Liquorilactobacillus uvarum]|nr:VOC family protein [Liquorilactobacillus uvarum]
MPAVIPKFRLSENTHTGTVALKVADLEKQTLFYQNVIGLKIIQKTEKQSILGAENDETPLLILNKVEDAAPAARKTGLYHVAFLLPSRRDLGNALIHYLTVKAPFIGASDHGYSEALYLTDLESNGIEVYHDKPRRYWDVREDGEIPAITIEMDAQGVIDASDRKWNGFPRGTKVGHVHLKVSELKATQTFYNDILGLSLKTNFGNQAKFFATGSYHHHIGTNIWTGKNIPAMDKNDIGLDYYTFFVENTIELARIEQHWQEHDVVYEKDKTGVLSITDPNGISIQIQIESFWESTQ